MTVDYKRKLNRFFAQESDVLEWGAVPAVRPPHAPQLEKWISLGRHADLKYMESNLGKRTDPKVFKPWVKSIIMFSVSCRDGFHNPGDSGYRIAAYALDRDYHIRCRYILQRLEHFLRSEFDIPDLQYFGFTDTAPVFERDLASEAGLGWRAKNCCTLNRRYGSLFMLSGCFVNLELEYSKNAVKNYCGRCSSCLDECPTGALTGPGQLDARKCISYHTIENKGAIMVDTKKFGNRIFGCDICQEVCPWNRKPIKGMAESSAADFNLNGKEWLHILRNGGGFNKKYKDFPLSRAGRKMMLRNLAIAARNNKDTSTLTAFRDALKQETDPVVCREIHRTIEELERHA